MKRILIVDDDNSILEMLKFALGKWEAEVTAARTGEQALEIFTENTGIDALITDYSMIGDMTGVELAERLLDVRPDLTVCLSCTFIEPGVAEKCERLGIKILRKPYTMERLREVLGL